MAENGYFSEEPLVTIASQKAGKWIVVEGNRRLAALRLLESPQSAPPQMRDQWQALAASAKEKITETPTLEYEAREQITPYLGYRHITGVLPWRPYQKGRYVADLIEEYDKDFSEIAKLIGTKASTVREHYVTYTLVRQARKDFKLDTDLAQGSIGVLRRALSEPGIRSFIGLNLDRSERQLRKPLPTSKAKYLKELFAWTFGTSSRSAAIRDSRDLSKLSAVLSSDAGLDRLRATNDLQLAYEVSGGEELRAIELLDKATFNIDQALPLAAKYKSSSRTLAAAERCISKLSELTKLLGRSQRH